MNRILMFLILGLALPAQSAFKPVGGGNAVRGNQWLMSAITSATNIYRAENQALGFSYTSNDFSGLLQRVVNQMGDGGYIKVLSNPYYTNAYVFSNTVTFTNWGILEGDGNPVTVFRAAPGLATPMIKLGDATHVISGINRINRIRFEGDQGAAGGVGVQVVNCAEPVFEFCEWTGFKLSGIQFSILNPVHWAFASHCWFVLKDATAHGALFDSSPATEANNHFTFNDCIFGVSGAGYAGITVSNRFPNLRVLNCHFRALSGSANAAFYAYAGGGFQIVGNEFVNCGSISEIYFEDRVSATNYNTLISGNKSTGTGLMTAVGDFVQGITMIGNTINGPDTYALTGNNSVFNNFDNIEFRVGDAALTHMWTTNITLDFPSTSSTFADLQVPYSLTASGDIVEVVPPPGSITTINGSYSGYASNGAAYVRFQSGAATQNPASGTFRVLIKKFR